MQKIVAIDIICFGCFKLLYLYPASICWLLVYSNHVPLAFFFFKTGWEGSSEGDLISKRQLPAECECDACQVKQRKDGEKLFFFLQLFAKQLQKCQKTEKYWKSEGYGHP